MIVYSEVLAWTLLHFLWQGIAVGAAYMCVARSSGSPSANKQYNRALAALLCMAAAFSLTAIYEFARLTYFTSQSSFVVVTTQHFFGQGEYQSVLPFIRGRLRFSQWIDALWVAGSLSLLIRSFVGQWIHYRAHRRGYFLHTGELYERFTAVAKRMHLDGMVRLRLHFADTGPFVSGAFRSVVYLPLSVVTNLPAEHLEWIFMHELAHVQRADYIWNIFQTVMESLFFFHPVVWWLGRILREQRELCCDAVVVESCPDPALYAKTLLDLAEIQYRHVGLALPATGQNSPMQLLHRVKCILGDALPYDRKTSIRPFRNISTAGLAVVALVACFFIVVPFNSTWTNHGMGFGGSISSRQTETPVISGLDVAVPAAKTSPALLEENTSGGLHKTNARNIRPQISFLYPVSLTASDGTSHPHRHSDPHEHHHHHRHDSDV